MKPVRIATRGSALALAPAGHVARAVAEALGCATELVPIVTSGDRLAHEPLAKIGGKGLFVKEIEEALLDGRADLAVHSAKDLPATLPPGLVLAAFPPRADPRDALIGPRAGRMPDPRTGRTPGMRLSALPRGARVGTGSARRGSQLLALRPDLVQVPLRGNVDTRLRRLEERGLDAIVLACAGLERLGRADVIHERIDPAALLPAVGQGTLALEARAGDPLAEALRALDDATTRACLTAERAFLRTLEGDCNVPLAAYAEPLAAARLWLRALVASPDGCALVRGETEAPLAEAESAGARVGRDVLARGGAAILAQLRAAAPA
jgi:hydroxymethylbilane synthase